MNTDSEVIRVQITYLEQRQRPVRASPPRPKGVTALMRAEAPPPDFYRYLFNAVGEPYHWASRRYMDDEELIQIIHDDDVYIYVPYFQGAPCGIAEIDARDRHENGDSVEIKFFGLTQPMIGRGIGNWFFHNTAQLAWSLEPSRVQIETCTADSPVALTLYQKHGFTPYSTSSGVIDWRG